jgi:hypothetical protein
VPVLPDSAPRTRQREAVSLSSPRATRRQRERAVATASTILRKLSSGVLSVLIVGLLSACGNEEPAADDAELWGFFRSMEKHYPNDAVLVRRIDDMSILSEALAISSLLSSMDDPPCYVAVTHPDGRLVEDVLRELCERNELPKAKCDLGIYVDSDFVTSIRSILSDCPVLSIDVAAPGAAKASVHAGVLSVEPPPPPSKTLPPGAILRRSPGSS